MQNLEWKRQPASALLSDGELQTRWNLLNQQRGNLPFLDAAAVCTALRCFGSGTEQLLVAHAGSERVAMLLLTGASSTRWLTFQPSQLPLGGWVAESSLTAPLLARSLATSGALPLCLSLSLTQIDSALAPMELDTSTSRSDAYIDTAWVDIAGSFDDYWAQRGKNLRQNMRKQRNKLQSEGIVGSMRQLDAAADMPAAVARYGELEGRGWKAQQGTAIKPDNVQGLSLIHI